MVCTLSYLHFCQLPVCLSVCLHGHLNPLYTAYMVAKEEQLISSSLKPKGQWHWGLVCSFRDMGPTTFAQKQQLFVAFPWVETSTGPGGFMICVFII